MQSNTSHARYILTLIIAVVIDETGVLSFMFTAGRSLSLYFFGNDTEWVFPFGPHFFQYREMNQFSNLLLIH